MSYMSKCNYCKQEMDEYRAEIGVGLCEPCEFLLHSSMGISAYEIESLMKTTKEELFDEQKNFNERGRGIRTAT